MSPNVEQVKRSIQGLPPVEMKELFDSFKEFRPTIDDCSQKNAGEAVLLHNLLEKGLITEIVTPMTDEEDDGYELIEIGGEPLSHAILRERR